MIESLNNAFCILPGVGKKSAQRFVYHLLEHNRGGAIKLAKALIDAMEHIGNCKKCKALSENDICEICANDKRDKSTLCIVETPADIYAIEQSKAYNGVYFVLGGYLSPIDGIGSKELGLQDLEIKLELEGVGEIILATNATIEGEVTAHYISNMAQKFNIKITRLAHGIPIGGELEYAGINTIAHAISGRKNYE